MSQTRNISCAGRCERYPYKAYPNCVLAVYCSNCSVFVIPKYQSCSCCGSHLVRGRALTAMQAKEVNLLYQILISDSRLPKLLGILEQGKARTTTRIREELNGHHWSDVLTRARKLGLVKSEKDRRYGRILNKITVRGLLLKQLAQVLSGENNK